MLETRTVNADARSEGDTVVILLHGRGADASDLAPLARWLPSDAAVVLPAAPFEAAPWGYGPGRAWYRYEGEDRPEPESFRTSQAELEELVEGISGVIGFDPGAVFLGGFSQGGTMSLGYALRRPGSVAGVLNFSGFVPSHPEVVVTAESVRGTRFFWGHGTEDPAIPFRMARAGRERLIGAGADLEGRDYPMGHGILPGEVRDAVAWMERILDGGPAGDEDDREGQ